jgi:N-acetylmuramoyl-L-alanine amidase
MPHTARQLTLGLLVWTLALVLPAAPVAAEELFRVRTIVLDPGHGGSNEGAVGVAGIYERFLTLQTAFALRRALTERYDDVTVLLTRERDEDLGLSERAHYANLFEADVFISLHYNAAVNADAAGIEVYFLAAEEPTEPDPLEGPVAEPGGAIVASILGDLEQTRLHSESATLAELVHAELIGASGAADRGVRQAQFRVLRGAEMPAVVVELGFLTHPEEGVRLLDETYRDQLVEALVEGVAAFDAHLCVAGSVRAGSE